MTNEEERYINANVNNEESNIIGNKNNDQSYNEKDVTNKGSYTGNDPLTLKILKKAKAEGKEIKSVNVSEQKKKAGVNDNYLAGNQSIRSAVIDKIMTEDIPNDITRDISNDKIRDKKDNRTNLNISQKIADIIEMDLYDPNREDAHISTDSAGNEKYFGCYVPEGYIINQQGIWKLSRLVNKNGQVEDTATMVCRTRLMITGKFVNADAGADVVEITFVGDANVETILVPLVATLGPKEWRDHVRKNNYGRLDVLDEELKNTLKFLKEASKCNMEKISNDPKHRNTEFKTGEAFERAGWNTKDFSKFVIGTSMYKNDFYVLKVDDAHFIDTRNIDVDNRLKPKGTIHGWFDSVKAILKYHRLKFAMYYAIGSLFLAPCKSSNSAFGIIGDTSIGKTFTLQIIASMFGNPSEKGDGLILNGNISLTALNAILTTLTDIPVFIDEITMMNDETKKALTYAIGNGQEALRGKQDGNLRSSRMIRCNVVITGEVDIVSEFAHNGAQVRSFSCKERPIPVIEQSTIRKTQNGILENYGHVMRLVLAKYFKDPTEVKGLYESALYRLQDSTTDVLAKRKAAYFATAEVGGIFLEEIFKENGLTAEKPQNIINEAWEEFVLNSPDTPLEIKALGDVYRWTLSKPRNFLIGDKQPAEDHPDDLYGWWVYPKGTDSCSDYEFLDLNKAELEKQLRILGYSQTLGILRYWRGHDITVCNTGNTDGKKTKDGTKKVLTFKASHYYQYNKPAQKMDIIRIRMDKIKELIEIIEPDVEVQSLDENNW